MTPAASLRSNIGSPHISQNVLRGWGSSVNSTDTAHLLLRQYSICARICTALRSGRNEKVPWVTRILVLLRRGRSGNEIGRVSGRIVERHIAPGVERRFERL